MWADLEESKLMLLRFLVLASIVVALGCTHQEALVEKQREAIHQRWEREKQDEQKHEQKLAEIRQYQLPKNYQQLIDAYFVQVLKDPDSRRIEYTVTPFGSLACGTINAKNSFGGYTGKQPFFAYFGTNGNLVQLVSFPDDYLGNLRLSKDRGRVQLEYKLLQHCGFQ